MKEKEYITGYCPNCNFKIDFTKDDKVVQCPACDNSVSVSSVMTSLDVKAAKHETLGTSGNMVTLYQQIESPESGLAYLENYFETYDWEEFYQTSRIVLPTISVIVEKQKVTNAASPKTWLLEFRSIIVPLMKKIEGIKILEKEMADKYDPIDDTNIYELYDNYCRIVKSLIVNKEDLITTLLLDIKYAEKYGLESENVDSMKEQVVLLNENYKNITMVSSPQEIGLVEQKIKDIEYKIVKELEEKGINAEEVYNKALNLYLHNNDKTGALNEFEKIRLYKDSAQYIYKINRLYNYNNVLYEIGGLNFTSYVDRVEPLNLNPNNSNSNNNSYLSQSQKGVTFGLYEIISGIPSKKPVVKGISEIICIRGSNLFFIKNNTSICVYNTISRMETILDNARPNDYKDANNKYHIYFSKDGSKFFLRRKLTANIIEPGCFEKLQGKQPTIVTQNNNYSIVLVDVNAQSSRTILGQIIDILDYFDNRIFYSVYDKSVESKERFMMYDLNDDSNKDILDVNCVIHTVHDNKIIYSRLSPNIYNKDLHCYDLINDEDVLLEDNIYNYFNIIDNKVYYTIGNNDYEPLFSIDLDGNNRTEILPNVIEILFIRAGWMYVLKGYGRNAALVKISVDGYRRITLCSRISKFIKFVDGYVYYLDNDNDLHIVRNDGKEDFVLVENVDSRTIITDNEKIYFLRHETVGDTTNNSLYSIDLDGNDIKKIIFDVDSIKEYDETNIYLNKREVEKWRIVKTTVHKVSKAAAIFFTILTVLAIIFSVFSIREDNDTVGGCVAVILISLICTIISWVVYSKKKNNPKVDVQTFVNTYKLNKYYSYNKVFGQMNEVLSLGKPDFDEIYTKKKLPNESYTFTLLKVENKYYRQNVVKAGSNFKEEQNKFAAQQQANSRK